MCGIGLLLACPATENNCGNHNFLSDYNERLSTCLSSRGPDVPCKQYTCANGDVVLNHESVVTEGYHGTLHASVLHMRGKYPAVQPVLFPITTSCYASEADQNTKRLQLSAITAPSVICQPFAKPASCATNTAWIQYHVEQP